MSTDTLPRVYTYPLRGYVCMEVGRHDHGAVWRFRDIAPEENIYNDA